jgi:hypothetical protein
METPCSRLLNFNLLPEPLPWKFRIRQTDKPRRRPAQPQSGELRFEVAVLKGAESKSGQILIGDFIALDPGDGGALRLCLGLERRPRSMLLWERSTCAKALMDSTA